MTLFDHLLIEIPQSVKDLLEELKGLRENPQYHPEESTYEHIRIVVERLADTQDENLVLTGLFHDLFKLKTAIVNERTGHPSSPLHDKEVAKFIRSNKEVQEFIVRWGGDVETVAFMCEQHMRVKRLGEMSSKKRWALMAHDLFEKLTLFTLADKMQTDWSKCYQVWKVWSSAKEAMPMGDVTFGWLREEEEKRLTHDERGYKAEHRLSGKDLIAMGYPQGKVIGVAINMVDEKYADAPIDEVQDILKEILDSPSDYTAHDDFGLIAALLLIHNGVWEV